MSIQGFKKLLHRTASHPVKALGKAHGAPATPVPSGWRAAAAKPSAFTDGLDTRKKGIGFPDLNGTQNPASAEGAVAGRADRLVPMRLDNTTTQPERLANLNRLTQVDGDRATPLDRQSCGAACILAGVYFQNPEGLGKIAAMELDKNGSKLDGWAKTMGVSPDQLRKDLEAIKSGNASPKQISQLSQVVMLDAKDRQPGSGKPGLDVDQMRVITGQILKQDSGVDAPQMNLELRHLPDGQHWTAEFDYNPMKDLLDPSQLFGDQKAVLTYDPWPNSLGGARTGTAFDHQSAKGLAQGAHNGEFFVGRDGTIN